jgi:hypothetical protein
VTVSDANVPDIGQSLGIELDGQAVGGSGHVDWDLVTLDYEAPGSATPLPATLPLFAGGLSAIGLFGSRRKGRTLPSQPSRLNITMDATCDRQRVRILGYTLQTLDNFVLARKGLD